MTQISPSEYEGFVQRYRLIKNAWLYSEGNEEECNRIIIGLFNEIEEFLGFPQGN